MSAPEPAPPTPGGVTLAERRTGLVEVSARRGRERELGTALQAQLGVALPEPGRASAHGDIAALWIAPATALIVGPLARLQELRAAIPPALAAVVDQSGGFAVVQLAGPCAAAALAKGCRVDLDPRAFGAGCVARTIIAQVPAIVHRVDAGASFAPAFDLFVPATLARSFVEFLLHAAAEFGCDVGASA